MSVAENVALTSELAEHNGRLTRTFDRKALARTAAKALEAVGLPGDAEFQSTLIDGGQVARRGQAVDSAPRCPEDSAAARALPHSGEVP